MQVFNKGVLALAISSALFTSATLAQVEQDTEQGSEPQSETREKIFERIEVTGSALDQATTATGLPLTLRQTPQSISIIDRTFIDSFSLNSVADVMQFAPGIHAQQAETDRFFFRARGRDITNFQFDGVPISYDSFFSEAVNDSVMFERVEVVRGATGLLTGAGEPSAAINLIRKRPKVEDGGYANAQFGSWNNRRLELDHSQTLAASGDVKGRVAMAYEEGENFTDLAEKENLQLYGVVTADLSAHTRLTLGADYSQRNPQGSMWGALPLFYADGSQADDLPVSTTTASDWSKWDRESINGFVQLEHAFDNGWDVQLDVEHRQDEMDADLVYMFGFPDRETGLGLGASSMIYQSDREQTSFRALASGPFEFLGRQHQLTAGALHSEQEITADSFYAQSTIEVGNLFEWGTGIERPVFGQTPAVNYGTETQTGVYAAAQLNVHDDVTVILGNRLSEYDIDGTTGIYKHSSVNTPYAGVVYDLTDTLSGYLSYTEIFQPQAAKDVNNRLVGPVEGSNIEAGLKGDFFNEALTASFAVFKVKEDNLAVPDPDNTELLPGGVDFPHIGIAGAESDGYEIELTGKPTDSLNIFFSYTHTESEDANGIAYAPYLPEDMIKASVLYAWNDAFRFGVNANWQSEVSNPGVGPNGETFNQGSYTVVNAMASYQLSQNWDLNLNLNNLFDEKYYSSIDFFNQGFFGAPRNVQLSVKYAW
ncbi:TonB-dependent siderophore receptor [Aliidiomarina sedimenti]|uniref:TonB-dependent siderophore receptor n=1 Tax=Aliidiomarina sedimenti TaxID=1933879 RepID=A0ABY0BYI6_9GAMM|nr:TonB-dependent siderophore receptor [Aliidiomarina sedimenti]RUO29755.1 TonB-dependent siderophore receptor [Aliidiomarina sedimenti]